MKVTVIGSGRMGIRHAQGALLAKGVNELIVTDINSESLTNAKNILSKEDNSGIIKYMLNDEYFSSAQKPDVVIMAATASNRIESVRKLMALQPKYILLEKPLGQSQKEVMDLINVFKSQTQTVACVNLNMRMYPSFIKLKQDITSLPQFNGIAEVTINTGTIGIGANGIHYIDLMKYLFDADKIEMEAGSINEEIIPSGRGPQFCDFGGWCVMNYLKEGKKKARVIFNLASESTVFGTMNFTFPHARVIIDEFEQKRYNKYRKQDSEMPVQRYAADYQAQEIEEFISPELKLLTENWLNSISERTEIALPKIEESFGSHQAMFEWLKKSKTHKEIFPIT